MPCKITKQYYYQAAYSDVHIVGDVKIDRFLSFFHNGVKKCVFLSTLKVIKVIEEYTCGDSNRSSYS